MVFKSIGCVFGSLLLLGQDYSFRMFTPKDGLSHTTIHSSFQDEDGLLWLGTYESIDLFNGIRFWKPPLTSSTSISRVKRVVGDPTGGHWLATHTGAIHVCDGRVRVYNKHDGLADDSIGDVLRDREGRLWIATAAGLNLQMPDGGFRIFTDAEGLPHAKTHRLLQDPSGTIWVGTQAGLARGSESGFQPVPLPAERDPGIFTLAIDELDRLWVGSDLGLFCLQDETWFRFDERHGLPSSAVWALCFDRFGRLWVGSEHGAVFADPNLTDLESLFFEGVGDQEVGATTIYSIEEDREGNLWFGTCVGLFQLRESAMRNVDLMPQGVGAMVLSMTETTSGQLWYGTDRGVVLRENGQLRNVTQELGLPDLFVRALAATRDGGLWFGTRTGALYLNGSRRRLLNRSTGMRNDRIFCMLEASDDTMYFGTLSGGVMSLKGDRQRWYGEAEGLSGGRVYALCENERGGIWVGTERGLDQITPDGVRHFEGDLLGVEVTALLQDRQRRLWIGTNEGVALFDQGRLRSMSPYAGAPREACRFLAEDDFGAIWSGGTRGIWRYENGRFQQFDGAAETPREMNFGAWAKDQHGALWFGHYAGVLQLEPSRVGFDVIPPPIKLTDLNVFNRPLAMSENLQLPYKQNQPAFSFSGVNFRAPRQLTYEYHLEGYEHAWLATDRGQVSYPPLQPGFYTFSVRARDRDGTPSRTPASFSFTIKPPFWRSWWFLTCLALGFLGLVLSQIWNLRLRNRMLKREADVLAAQVSREQAAKLQKEAELKLLHSQMNPHFLQNAFAGALYFVKSSPDKAEQMLRKLSTLFARGMRAKRSVWATVEEERLICEDYLEIQKIRFGGKLSYRIACPEPLRGVAIPSFILQPLVENAVIHGLREMMDHLEVTLDVQTEAPDRLRVTVANTGQPLDVPPATLIREGHALDNINKRLNLLNVEPLSYKYAAHRHQFTLSLEARHADHLG